MPKNKTYKFHNIIMMSHDVYHTVEAESIDAALELLHEVDCYDNIDVEDFVELYDPKEDWVLQEIDGEWILE